MIIRARLPLLFIALAAAAVTVVLVNEPTSPAPARSSSSLAMMPRVRAPASQPEPAHPSGHGQVVSLKCERAQTELVTAFAELRNEADPELQALVLSGLIDQLAGQERAAAITFLNTQEPSELLLELGTLFARRLAEADPLGASQTAMQLREPMRANAFEGVALVWANEKLDDAIAWAEQFPDASLRQNILRAIAGEAARCEPKKAIELVAPLASSPERDGILAQAAAQWAGDEPRAAADWASQIEDTTLKHDLLGMIATSWSEANPVEASNLALQSLPAGKMKDDVITAIVQRWTEQNSEAAADWVAQLPGGELREAAIGNLVKLWVDQDAPAAADWLNTLAITTGRDSGASAFAEQMSPSLPAIAMHWAESISDEFSRASYMENVATVWIASDPVFAQSWFAKARLTGDLYRKLGPLFYSGRL